MEEPDCQQASGSSGGVLDYPRTFVFACDFSSCGPEDPIARLWRGFQPDQPFGRGLFLYRRDVWDGGFSHCGGSGLQGIAVPVSARLLRIRLCCLYCCIQGSSFRVRKTGFQGDARRRIVQDAGYGRKERSSRRQGLLAGEEFQPREKTNFSRKSKNNRRDDPKIFRRRKVYGKGWEGI